MSFEDQPGEQTGLCNLDYLLVNLGRNQTTARRLVSLFLDHYGPLCERMERAAAEGNLAMLKDALHDIRSSCVLFSASECVDLARSIEDLLRDRLHDDGWLPPVDWVQKALELRRCMDRMAQELAQYLDA